MYSRYHGGNHVFLTAWVDNLTLFGSPDYIAKLHENLEILLDLMFLGNAHYLLVIKIRRRVAGKVMLHLERFIIKVLMKNTLESYKLRKTPLDPGAVTVLTTQPARGKNNRLLDVVDVITNQSIVGSLIYISLVSRPDLAHAAAFLGRFNSKPTHVHFLIVKHVLHYLQQTTELAPYFPVCVPASATQAMQAFADTNLASYVFDQKSTSGIAIYVIRSLVFYKSKKQ